MEMKRMQNGGGFGRYSRFGGFTALEMIVVMTIAAILMSIGAPLLLSMAKEYRVKAASTTIYLALIKARSEAVKRNSVMTMTPIGGLWQSGWKITDTNSVVVSEQGAFSNVTVTTAVGSLVYTHSGRVRAATVPTFAVTTSGASQPVRCVSVDLTGQPYVKAAAC